MPPNNTPTPPANQPTVAPPPVAPPEPNLQAGGSPAQKPSFVQKVGASKLRLLIFALVFAGIGGVVLFTSFAADTNPLPVKKNLLNNNVQQIPINNQFIYTLPTGWTHDICQNGTLNITTGEKLYPPGQSNNGHCKTGGLMYLSTTQILKTIAKPDSVYPLPETVRIDAEYQAGLANPVHLLVSQIQGRPNNTNCTLKQTNTVFRLHKKRVYRSLRVFGTCGTEVTYQYYPYGGASGSKSFFAAYLKYPNATDLTSTFDQIVQSVNF